MCLLTEPLGRGNVAAAKLMFSNFHWANYVRVWGVLGSKYIEFIKAKRESFSFAWNINFFFDIMHKYWTTFT